MNSYQLGILRGATVALAILLGAAGPTAAQGKDKNAPSPRSQEQLLREEATRRLTEALENGESLFRPKAGAAAAAVPAGPSRATAAASGPVKCLPTCDTADGRFLAIAGDNLGTLSLSDLFLQIQVPANVPSFALGFFDGDNHDIDADGNANWDIGSPTLFEYELFADPAADGSGTTPVEMLPGQTSIPSTAMPDNDWIDFTITTGPEARTPSGNYFYVLRVRLVPPVLITLNAFKVRSTGILTSVTLHPIDQPFSYIASWTDLNDISIVYPNFPDPLPTTYDGNFRFFIDIPVSQGDIEIWDGDFDRGNFDHTNQDTDDPDTPALPLPPWSMPDTLPEGTADGGVSGTGNPPDNESTADFGVYIVREPTVRYDLIAPDGRIFSNDNPSGNREWERFNITTEPGATRAEADYVTDGRLPAGIYSIAVRGVDMLNLNSLVVPFRVLCEEETGEACTPLRPYRVGDTVFFDSNSDGDQDAGEMGVYGVTLEILDEAGEVLATVITGSGGQYSFGVERGRYAVRVAASNFAPGGALAGATSTTGGHEQSGTVIDDNVLTLDFGYSGSASLGDRVWRDDNGDGCQDPGEPGLNGVTVQLLDGNGNVVATTVTAGDGNYSFMGLAPGTYTVRVVPSTLPRGSSQSYDFDGIVTPHQATVAVGNGEVRPDLDFGYQVRSAIIGGKAWFDLCTCQANSQTGLFGLTMKLRNGSGAVIATTVTDGYGKYSFADLAPGSYVVKVEVDTLPAGFTASEDADGISTPDKASVSLLSGQSLGAVDFGYRAPASPGTGAPVWWKNHGSTWPVRSLQIGGAASTKAQALALLGQSNDGDKTVALAKQLIAAKLNVLSGNHSSCIIGAIQEADAWLGANPAGSGVGGASPAWSSGLPLRDSLDSYNSGLLCAPPRN